MWATKQFYFVNFNKEFNSKLLPHSKLTKKIPTTIDKEAFNKIFYGEKSLKHKCWLLLAYCSGLRAEEIANVKIKDINADEHQLKVLGKRKKERYTFLPEITVRYLRMYYKSYYCQPYNRRINKTGYLFEGYKYKALTSKTIVNYFTTIKKYNLDEDISFHSLRHSFATNFIKSGGDPFVLKSMLGHSSLNTTSIYIHIWRDFNNQNVWIMMRFSIQDIFREYGNSYIKKHKLSEEQWKVYNAIINCKTTVLGIQTITCEGCGDTHIALNSCRNRHCPNC